MRKFKKYLFLLIILLIAAINFNIILRPLNLASGGTQGLAIIISHIFKVTPATIILIINLLMLVISYFILPKETIYGTIIATFIYPFLVKLTSNLNFLNISDNYIFIFVILSGITCGITGGLIYKLGFSSGGLNVIALIIRKYFHINIAITNFILNTIIILLGCFYFGIIKGLYAILVILINSYIINKILSWKKLNLKYKEDYMR